MPAEKIKLLSCPFCGGNAGIFGSDGHYYAACIRPGCLCSLGEQYDPDGMDEHLFGDKESAAYNWNRRADTKETAATNRQQRQNAIADLKYCLLYRALPSGVRLNISRALKYLRGLQQHS